MNESNSETIIVVDSCCELTSDFENVVPVLKVPFHIIFDNKDYIDDENLNVSQMIKDMKLSKTPIKSACPSPQDFIDIFEKFTNVKNIFLVTLSSKLSGANNSAETAKKMFLERSKDTFIHVFDSLGASPTEMNVVMKINECIKEKLSNSEIISSVNNYINNLHTYFILQSFDNFIKNGRLSKTEALLIGILNIVPIMQGVNGEIKAAAKARGMNKALLKLIEIIKTNDKKLSEKILSITHCNAQELAIQVKELLIKNECNFKEIIINNTAGLSSMYAEEGGIIISY